MWRFPHLEGLYSHYEIRAAFRRILVLMGASPASEGVRVELRAEDHRHLQKAAASGGVAYTEESAQGNTFCHSVRIQAKWPIFR